MCSTVRKTAAFALVPLALVLVVLLGVIVTGVPASAQDTEPQAGPDVDPTPIDVQGNVDCVSQGYDYELKIDASELTEGQTYTAATTIDGADSGPLSVTLSNLVLNSEGEKTHFDWASNNFPVDAVIVKAKDSQAFIYDDPPESEESMGDDGLYAPEEKGISHISFCYDLELKVTKDAQTSFKKTFDWRIDKLANPVSLEMFNGDPSKSSNYTISLTKDGGTDSDWKVTGNITVTSPIDATITGVTDSVSGAGAASVDCGGTFPIEVTAGEELNCTYSRALSDASTRTNTADATTSTDGLKPGQGTAEVNFANADVEKVNDSITVTDSYSGGPQGQSFNESGSTTYSRPFSCPEDAGTNNNTATINELGRSANASVEVTCIQKGSATVKKTTNGVVDPSKSINFVLTGPGLPSSGVTKNTSGDQDGVLEFGEVLLPGETYKVCESPVPAGFTSFWKLDGTIVEPYNPDASKVPPEDLGVRCYDFSANAGQTLAFEVDNSRPGGDPRTIGYWKNWNKCTSGNQATTAAKNGGAAAGFFVLEDLLPKLQAPALGKFNVTTCQQAVKVLSKQDQSGKSKAKDAAYELAAQLLAARLNLAAGAETCSGVQTAVMDGQALLYKISFTGSGSYLEKSSTNRTSALNLAAKLDKYNNGNLC